MVHMLQMFCDSFKVAELTYMTVSVLLWSEFLATDPEFPGSIPSATTFSE
jgi:hypothetical protein